MKFEMKKPIFECPYCHEKIEGDYAAYQEHVQVCYEKDMARQKLKNEKEIRLKKLNEDAKKFEEDYLKIGPYIKTLGGLDSSTTNQKFFRVANGEICDLMNDRFVKKTHPN